jgi:hypothetical protein
MRSRVTVVSLCLLAALVAAFAAAAVRNAQSQAAAVESPALNAPGALASLSDLVATLAVVPSHTWVQVGDPLNVSLSVVIDPSSTCGYAIYELILRQTGPDAPVFDYIDPPTERKGAPISGGATFLLQAAREGTVVLNAHAYGETYCGFWQWHYIYGQPVTVTVTTSGPSRYVHLPTIELEHVP